MNDKLIYEKNKHCFEYLKKSLFCLIHMNDKLINDKNKHSFEYYIFYRKKLDLDPLFPEVVSRIRIRNHIKMKRVRNTGSEVDPIKKWMAEHQVLIITQNMSRDRSLAPWDILFDYKKKQAKQLSETALNFDEPFGSRLEFCVDLDQGD